MQRPAGVTASAVVAFLGSAVALLLGAATLRLMREPGPAAGAVAAVVGAVLIALAALGIWTGVSLLRLRPWARSSILVFGGFLAVTSALSAITAALMPLASAEPQGLKPLLVAVFYLFPLGIGVWWVVYFTRPRIKAAFGRDRAAAGTAFDGSSKLTPRRPLGIAVLGWLWIVGAALNLLWAAAGWPFFLVGHVITGWRAVPVYLVFAVISLYLGWGLLKLSTLVWRLAIAWAGLMIAHTLYLILKPGGLTAMVQMQRAIPLTAEVDPALMLTQLAINTAFGGLVIPAAVIWMLIRHRPAFSAA